MTEPPLISQRLQKKMARHLNEYNTPPRTSPKKPPTTTRNVNTRHERRNTAFILERAASDQNKTANVSTLNKIIKTKIQETLAMTDTLNLEEAAKQAKELKQTSLNQQTGLLQKLSNHQNKNAADKTIKNFQKDVKSLARTAAVELTQLTNNTLKRRHESTESIKKNVLHNVENLVEKYLPIIEQEFRKNLYKGLSNEIAKQKIQDTT